MDSDTNLIGSLSTFSEEGVGYRMESGGQNVSNSVVGLKCMNRNVLEEHL